MAKTSHRAIIITIVVLLTVMSFSATAVAQEGEQRHSLTDSDVYFQSGSVDLVPRSDTNVEVGETVVIGFPKEDFPTEGNYQWEIVQGPNKDESQLLYTATGDVRDFSGSSVWCCDDAPSKVPPHNARVTSFRPSEGGNYTIEGTINGSTYTTREIQVNHPEVQGTDKLELLRQHAPVLNFHPQENYQPTRIEAIFENSYLCEGGGGDAVSESATLRGLPGGSTTESLYLQQYPLADQIIGIIPPDRFGFVPYEECAIDSSVQENQADLLEQYDPQFPFISYPETLYANVVKNVEFDPSSFESNPDHVQEYDSAGFEPPTEGKGESYTALSYWMVYVHDPKPTNEQDDIINARALASHTGDTEFITVLLDDSGNPEWVLASQHKGGEYREWENVEKMGSNPVIYPADGAHSSFFGVKGGKGPNNTARSADQPPEYIGQGQYLFEGSRSTSATSDFIGSDLYIDETGYDTQNGREGKVLQPTDYEIAILTGEEVWSDYMGNIFRYPAGSAIPLIPKFDGSIPQQNNRFDNVTDWGKNNLLAGVAKNGGKAQIDAKFSDPTEEFRVPISGTLEEQIEEDENIQDDVLTSDGKGFKCKINTRPPCDLVEAPPPIVTKNDRVNPNESDGSIGVNVINTGMKPHEFTLGLNALDSKDSSLVSTADYSYYINSIFPKNVAGAEVPLDPLTLAGGEYTLAADLSVYPDKYQLDETESEQRKTINITDVPEGPSIEIESDPHIYAGTASTDSDERSTRDVELEVSVNGAEQWDASPGLDDTWEVTFEGGSEEVTPTVNSYSIGPDEVGLSFQTPERDTPGKYEVTVTADPGTPDGPVSDTKELLEYNSDRSPSLLSFNATVGDTTNVDGLMEAEVTPYDGSKDADQIVTITNKGLGDVRTPELELGVEIPNGNSESLGGLPATERDCGVFEGIGLDKSSSRGTSILDERCIESASYVLGGAMLEDTWSESENLEFRIINTRVGQKLETGQKVKIDLWLNSDESTIIEELEDSTTGGFEFDDSIEDGFVELETSSTSTLATFEAEQEDPMLVSNTGTGGTELLSNDDEPEVRLYRPNGTLVDPENDTDVEVAELGNRTTYRIDDPKPEDWEYEVVGDAKADVLIAGEGTTDMKVEMANNQYYAGGNAELTATILGEEPISGAEVEAEITKPDGSTKTVTLNEINEGSGRYRVMVGLDQNLNGTYEATVTASKAAQNLTRTESVSWEAEFATPVSVDQEKFEVPVIEQGAESKMKIDIESKALLGIRSVELGLTEFTHETGNATISSSNISFDGSQLVRSGIGGNESVTVEVPDGAPTGTYSGEVGAFVDDDGTTVGEVEVKVFEKGLQPPQFQVSADSSSISSTTIEGEEFQIDATVENTGEVEDTQRIELLGLNGEMVGSEVITLGEGEMTDITLSWNTEIGDAGSGDVVVATDDSSDSAGATIEEKPTFAVDINGTNSPVVKGETAIVNATVENLGNVTDTQKVEMLNASNTSEIFDSKMVTLGTDERTNLSLNWQTEEDDVGIQGVAVSTFGDSDFGGIRVNETVNRTAKFGVNINETNSPVLEGEKLIVNVTVQNEASENVTDTQNITLRDTGFEDRERDSRSVNLSRNESETITLSWNISDTDGISNVTVFSENDSVAKEVNIVSTGAEGLSLSVDPGTAGSSSVHNWSFNDVPAFDPVFNDEVDKISVEYPDGASLDGLNEEDVTVVLTRELSSGEDKSEISVNQGSYSGSSATFDLSGFSTTNIVGSGYVEINGVENPAGGNYNATISFVGDNRGEVSTEQDGFGVNGTAVFDLNITDAKEEVVVGEEAKINYTVENTGSKTGTQDVRFDVDGVEKKTQSVTLNQGGMFNGTFNYTTGSGDVPDIQAEISTENDAGSRTVGVLSSRVDGLSLDIDPGAANASSVHNWSFTDVPGFDPVFEDNVDKITVEYPSGASLDGLDETNITVVLTRELSSGPDKSEISVNQGSYSGSSATFDLSGFSTTNIVGEGYVKIEGINNPTSGSYNANITFVGENRGEVSEGQDTFSVTDPDPSLSVTLSGVADTDTNTPVWINGTVEETAGAQTENLTVSTDVINESDGSIQATRTVGVGDKDDSGSELTELESNSTGISLNLGSLSEGVVTGGDDYTAELTAEASNSGIVSDADGFNVTGAFFEVNVTDTNSPVNETETLEVDAEVTNTGEVADTQDIRLFDFNGSVVNNTSASLNKSESTQVTLTWSTETGDSGTTDVSVESKDDVDTKTVSIE